ncbi:collagen alpha-5(VI) chain [Patella vulgata]|uniref:collagen alpha-5(VI) chain n=1 Tax=Patella vulgata TaxID=6465 RepID=UPI00217F8522|nr:collagen alpha-5(VI) chain [Patella vulgata]
MEFYGISISVICSVLFTALLINGQTADECGGYAADVMFLLDTSSSIEIDDFRKQLQFTQDVVKIFDIGRERTKVGVALFSDTVYPQFDLNAYNSKGHIVDRIGKIGYRGGRTNTAEALSFLRTKVFTQDQVRQGVPRIAIVLTDGLSNYPDETVRESKELHLNGITVFVIGIGNQTDTNELKAIASNPDSEYAFHVNNFDALYSVKKTLAVKTCKVEFIEPVIQQDILDTDKFFPGRLPCTISIVYGADVRSASTRTTRQIMSFFTLLNDRLQDDLYKVRSAQVINNCPTSRRYVPTPRKGKNYATLLLNMRQASPASLPAIKNPGKAMSILLVDTSIADLASSSKEVLRARFKRIDTFVVVVGTEASRGVLERLLRFRVHTASFGQHVFAVDNYDKLEAAISPLLGYIKKLKCS